MAAPFSSLPLFLLFTLLLPLAFSQKTVHHTFNIRRKTFTRLCQSKSIITANGRFPGPTITVTEGDRLVVKVVNNVNENVTVHWHGVRQLRTGWYDGPAYITQCPIQSGQSYTYNFSTAGQRGTFFWHAHISWIRATLYGPIIILSPPNNNYPFPTPYKEVPIILGEWWKADTEKVISQALQTGAGPNVSDAYTFNGFPGPFYSNCSAQDTFTLKATPGKTYLLRIINAALNDDLFFTIANHSLTVVEADASYTKPFTTQTLLITPGQTTNVLLTTLRTPPPNTSYLISVHSYSTAASGTFDNTTASAILSYTSKPSTNLISPQLPTINDTAFAENFSKRLKSLTNSPPSLPLTVDQSLFFTVGLGFDPCPKGQTCQGPNGSKFTAAMNNISFVLPTVALLQSRFGVGVNGNSSGVNIINNNNNSFAFPDKPLTMFDYTGTPPNNTSPLKRTGVKVLAFNTTVQVVLQDTSIGGFESHPLHLHGHNFFVVGLGFGNFDGSKDPQNFNLVDPPERNTIGVPSGGWAAIRFRADNPGVWFMHCHLEVHTSWGLKMAWVVQNGKGSSRTLSPPPPDLPQC